MDTIDIYQSEHDGQFYWHRKAPNGEVISSGEGHPRRYNAFRAVRRANLDNNWTYGQETLAHEEDD